MRKPRPTFWLYFLGAYVVLQFAWWGYHLIELSAYIPQEDAQLAKRIGMVFGEGAVFLFILIFGIYRIRKGIAKEFELQKRQNNFLLTVTHELKTPLAALKLYLQTLQKHNLTEEKKKVLSMVHSVKMNAWFNSSKIFSIRLELKIKPLSSIKKTSIFPC